MKSRLKQNKQVGNYIKGLFHLDNNIRYSEFEELHR